MVAVPTVQVCRLRIPKKPTVRLLDWARLINSCLDALEQCGSFSTLFGARTIREHTRIAAGNDCELREVPLLGAALPIELPKRLRNGHPLPTYLVVSMPQHLTAIAMVLEVAPGVARFVLLDSFQYLTTLNKQEVEPAQAVSALYETLHSAATVEDRERFIRFIAALERLHRDELVPRLAPSATP